MYLRPGRGVGGLSKAFGTKARRGTMTNTHKPAATGIIRHVLQQLESLKVGRRGLYTVAPCTRVLRHVKQHVCFWKALNGS